MNKRFLLFSLVLALVLPAASFADKDFSSWTKYSHAELVSETSSVAPGHPAAFGLHITLADHWHTYWVNPGDSGTAIRLKFKSDPAVKIQRIQFPLPERLNTGPLISFGYSHEVLLPIDVQIADGAKVGQPILMEADVEWLVCAEVCIPAFMKLQLEIPVVPLEKVRPSPDFGLFQKTRALLPEPQASFPRFRAEGDRVSLSLPQIPAEEEYVDFFPFRNAGVTQAPPVLDHETLHFEKANVASVAPDRVGILVLKLKSSGQMRALQFGESGWAFENQGGSSGVAPNGIWWVLLSAFFGGLILNLMPCVFPILSIKLLALLKLAKAHPREVRTQNLAYAAGVLFSFMSVALILSGFRSAGVLIGWGFQLQSPVFLALLSWLFFALSLNLLGVYEINFIDAGIGGRLTRVSGLWGSFFTGVLAVIVASPCTAPFMGAALGFGLSQSVPILLATFFMLGLGLAFPYLLFVAFPSWTHYLPRPGAWMNVVKQVMAFPMFATTLWLVWILAQVRGMPAVMIVLGGYLAMGFAFWLRRWSRATAVVLALVVLGGGLVGIYSGANHAAARVDDGVWKFYSEAAMKGLRGQNIFVNMTADWCLTCKVNERLIFSDPEVEKLLHAKNIVLVKGDWTQQNEEVTRFLNHYNRVGVPFYVAFSKAHPDGQPMPEIITKSSFIEFINQEFP